MVIFFGMAGHAMAAGTLVFCESLNEQFEPQNVGSSFPGPTVNLILTQDEPFGSPTLTATVYKRDGNQETVLERSNFDINPKWTAYAIRNMALPGPGNYAIGFTTPDGRTIAHEQVALTGGHTEKPGEPQETLGGTLEKVFNKYAPKKQ